MEENDRLRTKASVAIARAVQAARVPRLVQVPIVFVCAEGADGADASRTMRRSPAAP